VTQPAQPTQPTRPTPQPQQPQQPQPGDKGTVAVIGLGLIGGSLARDLAARGWRVLAADRDGHALAEAAAEGVITGTFHVGAEGPGDASGVQSHSGAQAHSSARSPASGSERAVEVLAAASLVIVATPVGTTPGVLRWLARVTPNSTIITDTGSTKRSIMAAAAAAGLAQRFVGGHPMAGDHRSGWGAAREDLFMDAPVWLCAARAAPALAAVQALWLAVGARPSVIDADDHDRLVAWSSHLPQLVSSALGRTLHDAGLDRSRLGPGGRDVTRLAGSDPAMWADILVDNADVVTPALAALLNELTRLHRHVMDRDVAAITAALAAARDWAGSAT
jgi:prephenate dehydrogenase